MNNRTLLTVGGLIGAGLIAVAVLASVLAAQRLSLREQEANAGRLAEQVLRRNERITDQVRAALEEMYQARLKDPCSEEARRLMSRIALRSSLLQAVVYVKGDRMACGSLDLRDVDLGPSDFTASVGTAIRTSRRLPMIDPQATYRITQSLATGYATVVNTELAFDIIGNDTDTPVGIVGSLSGQAISHQGPWQPQWLGRLRGQEPVAFFDGDYVVALRSSNRYEYFAYAAIPASRLREAWIKTACIVVPIGLVAAGVVAALIFLALRQQAGLPSLLKNALRSRSELYLMYQPFVDLQTGRWIGAEALMRWRRPDGEMVSPDVFVPMAERHGLVSELTGRLVEMVRHDMGELLRQHPDFFVSINVPAQDIMDEGFARRLSKLVRDWGIDPLQLRLEATERTLIDAQAAQPAIQRLQALGHRIALDDFGTGYSSLSYLATLKVDSIKIDKAFVETIGTDSVTAEVVPHIIEMGKALGLRLIGEGIETAAQADYLRERGVEYGQGWHFARALSPQDLARDLGRQG